VVHFSFIADKKLWKKTVAKENTYWQEKLQEDSDCYDLSLIKYPPVGALSSTIVVCFPGSGSKWMTELLEFASGYSTNM